MVEEIGAGAVQLIKPVKFETDDGELATKFDLQEKVLENLLDSKEWLKNRILLVALELTLTVNKTLQIKITMLQVNKKTLVDRHLFIAELTGSIQYATYTLSDTNFKQD